MSLHALPETGDLRAFQDAITAALRAPSGIVYGDGLDARPTAAEFTPDLTTEESAIYDALAQRVSAATADRADLVEEQVRDALQAANARIGQITNDRAALASATTLAQVRPIIDRQLNAEAATLAVLARVLKALRWLV